MDASVANSTCYEGRGDRATDGYDGVVRARSGTGTRICKLLLKLPRSVVA